MAEFLRETYFVVLPIIVTAFMGWVGTTLTKQQKERSANSRGTMLILKYMLERYHAEYMHKGYVTEEQYKLFEDIHDAYSDLGGNGYGDRMWQDVRSLPIKNDVIESISPYADYIWHMDQMFGIKKNNKED